MSSITPKVDFTNIFPVEISLLIFGYLSDRELVIAMRVRSLWKSLAQDDSLWIQQSQIFNYKRNSTSAREDWRKWISAPYNAHSVGLKYLENQQIKEAENYFKYAASFGYTISMEELGKIYSSMGKTEKVKELSDLKVAITNSTVFKNTGSDSLMDELFYNAAKRFESDNDLIVRKSDKNAFECMKKAADLQHEEALIQLGYYYYDGRGCVKNLTTAVKLWEKAAELFNNDRAQYLAGRAHYLGLGVKPSIRVARSYLKRSAKRGNEKAAKILEEIEPAPKKKSKGPMAKLKRLIKKD